MSTVASPSSPVAARPRSRLGLTAPARDRLIALGFTVLSLALAFWQRTGWASSDTKIDLHVDPSRFLSSVASVWTPTTDLGEVHSAQYSGYLWPMGPFYAAGHALGLSAWVVQRLWLAAMFALAAWGALKLLDALVGRPRGVAHVVGAAFYLLNPYVTVFSARTTITLLGYAALPWLLLVTLHGVRATGGWRGWRGWWWASAFALILTSSGGGVNAAVVGWMLVGPLVLALYEPAVGHVRWRDSIAFLVRVGVLGLLACLWWIVPLLVHVRYGIDFLQFTEQPASIWGTNSATESLRLMGYWTSYIGVGFGATRPFFSDSATLLFNPFVVGASLLLPALALLGFVRARRVGYAPLLLLLSLVGVVIMTAGFPDGTPIRGGMEWIYRHVFVLRFMRTTNKAAPLVAIGFAGLLGLGARGGLRYLAARSRPSLRRAGPVLAALAGMALLVLACLPLFQGRALDRQLLWKRIPPAWVAAGRSLDRSLTPNTRAMVLPGQIFGYYNWGGTVDAILPRLTGRPVAVRYETPYSDLHAVDLMTTVDDLVQQARLLPGQLRPLLRLMGVGAVITGADDDISRSGAEDPAAAAAVLAGQGLGQGAQNFGPITHLPAARGDIGTGASVPEVRRYDIAGTRGIVHVDPPAPATVVDGGAPSLADLAAFDALPAGPILYAGDQSGPALRAQAAAGAGLVVGDSNRRRSFLPESTQQNRGPTLAATDPVPAGEAVIDPFPQAGTDGQTVALLRGAAYLRSPRAVGQLQFPEHGPQAAFDGDPATAWLADRYLPVSSRWIEVGFSSPREVPYVDLLPLSDSHGIVREVEVNGIHHRIGTGWTRVALGLRHIRSLRVTIVGVQEPAHGLGGPGGLREIRVPGLRVSEALRAPIVLGRRLAGEDLSHSRLTYVFQRTTGDDPFRRNPYGTLTALNDPSDRGDPEAQIDRVVFAPASRRYSLGGWLYPSLATPDSELDRLAGYRGPVRLNSSGRFQDIPGLRASAAFTGRAGAGWVGIWDRPEAPLPWISWSSPRPQRLTRLRLLASTAMVRRVTQVAISWPGGATGGLPVGPAGEITLPHPVRARSFRLTILNAAWPAGASPRQRQAKAVGVGALLVPGLGAVPVPTAGRLHAPCGTVAVTVAGRRVPIAAQGTVAGLDAGRPVPASACAEARMAGGINEIRALPGPFDIDELQLTSPAPAPLARASTAAGALLASGHIGNSSVDGVRLALRAPAWLVLGESYDRGWRATCDGRSLGPPQVIDGYANGWLAPAGCQRAAFAFQPQSGARTSYLLSGAVCLLLALFLVVMGWRHRRGLGGALAEIQAQRREDPPDRARTLPAAAALALLLAVPVAAVFALRAGLVAFPLLTLVLWRGWGPRALVLTAAGLIGVVVPLAYLIANPDNRGGYNFTYASQLIYAHWVGVAAVILLALALVKLMRPLVQRDRRPRAANAVDDAPRRLRWPARPAR